MSAYNEGLKAGTDKFIINRSFSLHIVIFQMYMKQWLKQYLLVVYHWHKRTVFDAELSQMA
jgi:hypothetical protein